MKRRPVMQSSLNPTQHHTTRRPYERIRNVIKAAERARQADKPKPPERKS